MNALPVWDDEQPNALTTTDWTTTDTTTTPGTAPVPGGRRGAALADAIRTAGTPTDLGELVSHLLAAVDAADADAGIARVDTNDAVLGQRIARIVSGASLPSRGPSAQAKAVLSLLREYPAG